MNNKKIKLLDKKNETYFNLNKLSLDVIKLILTKTQCNDTCTLLLTSKWMYNIYNDSSFCVLYMKTKKIKFDYDFIIKQYKSITSILPRLKLCFYENNINRFLEHLIMYFFLINKKKY